MKLAQSHVKVRSRGRLALSWLALAFSLFGTQIAHTEVAQAPLFLSKYVPGNLALVPSVEWPTILSVANLGNYSASATYTGYFDSGKCYAYVNSGISTSHFAPVSLISSCSGSNRWSGNYLNWAMTQTIDPFRSALTGGYRIVDTPTETILEKARHTGQSATGRLSLTNSTTTTNATAASWGSNFYTRIDGLGNRMYFARTNASIYGTPTPVHYNPASHPLSSSTDNTVYEVYARVKVCDSSVGLEPNCEEYSQGYKPEGLIQEYSQKVRYSVFGYLNDENQQRDGGVLRANQKFVGPTVPLIGGGVVANPNAEWDATTGVFVTNPNPIDASSTATYFGTTVNNSGVINYLNKFGQLTNNNHKSQDPVSELFYTAVRYFKNQGCVPEYVTRYPAHNNNPDANTRARWVDGFPVLRDGEWEDPIEYRCQKNVILGIGDTNTHADRNLPGGVRNSGREPALPGLVASDDTVNVRTATEKVGELEGVDLNAGTITQLGTCCSNNSAYIAGLAYDSHTGDLRPELSGRQSVSTYWVDVREMSGGVGVLRGPSTNQYWLAAKYGGFLVPENFSPYDQTDPLPNHLWTAPNDTLTTIEGDRARPENFYVASDAAAMVASLETAFKAIVEGMQASSSSIAANSTRLDTGTTLIYQASFNSESWWGRIVAFDLNENGSVKSTVWDTNSSTSGIPEPDARNMVAGVGVQGALTTTSVSFETANWSSLNAEQQALLNNGGADAVGQARLEWLRGDNSNEGASGLGFRPRQQVLGDIVNSDPIFVGAQDDFGYLALPGTEGAAYATFLTSKSTRRNMLYVGANDGMLHGFDAQTGVERLAYVPLGVFPELHQLTAPSYQHRYYMDGSPRASDAYIGGSWRTVLVGSLGAGGRSVFALNVTNPAGFGPASLMWEYSATSGDGQLGIALSQPVIARVKAGDRWVAIFGNGFGLTSGNVRLLVVDLASGALLQSIDTGVSAVGNALATPVPVDINNDRITDYVYAGDLQGNLWKFDFTGNATNNWDIPLSQGGNPAPLFVAIDRDGVRQPITSRPAVGRHPDGGQMIYFGTGKYFETDDATVPATPQVQTFYGIRDQNQQVARGDLIEQEIIFEGAGILGTDENGNNVLSTNRVRAVSNNYSGQAPSHGWFIDLIPPPGTTGDGERAVSTPVLRFGRIIFTTIIPTEDPCDNGGKSWLMELDAITGGRLSTSVIDVNNDGVIDEGDYILVDGERIPVSGQASDEMIKTPGIISAGELEYKYTSGSSGGLGVIREKGAGDVMGRQSWRQMQ